MKLTDESFPSTDDENIEPTEGVSYVEDDYSSDRCQIEASHVLVKQEMIDRTSPFRAGEESLLDIRDSHEQSTQYLFIEIGFAFIAYMYGQHFPCNQNCIFEFEIKVYNTKHLCHTKG